MNKRELKDLEYARMMGRNALLRLMRHYEIQIKENKEAKADAVRLLQLLKKWE